MIFLELFMTFFKIGLFTFGGGYAMLPLIEAEVTTRSWIEMTELIDFIAVSESTPGPFAINMATYIGSELGGVFGSVCATLGVVMPSFIVILIVAKCYEKFKTNKIVAGCMTGLKPAAIGLIGSAAVTMAKTVFFESGVDFSQLATPKFYVSLATFALMTFLIFKKKHPIMIICLSALIGIVAGRYVM